MKHQNRLVSETSPYLLQHAHNPVAWYPWGPEALARAAAENKPILLSIGYAACHWCHVMERESFEDEAIAAQMNESFVCIKVDREERPDLDEIYMAATVALSGSGGWPMTVFLTPEQQPFFAGTYFPPVDKYGRPGFPTLLQNITELWQSDRKTLLEQAAELSAHVAQQARVSAPLAIGREALQSAARQLHGSYDALHGGFGKAPKFPPCAALSLLLRHHRNVPDASLLEMITGTLDGMKNGGMYDHLGGGFARYSTDERWLVPHFEKMLYDNAQLASVYLDAYQVTRDPEYARVARETLDYVIREMQEPNGAYFSATDADSEGVEGKFFVWSQAEVLEILGPEAGRHFAAYYDVSAKGNWEGQNVLNTPRPLARVAEELSMPEPVLRAELERSRKQLYQARKLRVPPLLDDKLLSSWNGLM
ncbi:MAG TPA: thioredoxin domain-containing protein, partial [Polyangiaceae bacterium]